jgi:hypothetical protein
MLAPVGISTIWATRTWNEKGIWIAIVPDRTRSMQMNKALFSSAGLGKTIRREMRLHVTWTCVLHFVL